MNEADEIFGYKAVGSHVSARYCLDQLCFMYITQKCSV
jgi:hypothetical protein